MIKRASYLLVPTILLYLAPIASGLEVCIDDKVALAGPARAEFHREFEFLLTRDRVRLKWGRCRSEVLTLSIERRRDGMPPSVLGAALSRGDVILPKLAVFADPVMSYTQAAGWNVVGRALARVAAHEVRHFLDQTDGHRPHGLMQAAFHPTELRVPDVRPFLR